MDPYNKDELKKLKKILVTLKKVTNKDGSLTLTKSSFSYELFSHFDIAGVRFSREIVACLFADGYVKKTFKISTGEMKYMWDCKDPISDYFVAKLANEAYRLHKMENESKSDKYKAESFKYKAILTAVLEETYFDMGESDSDMGDFLDNVATKHKHQEVINIWSEIKTARDDKFKKEVLDKLSEAEIRSLKKLLMDKY